MTKTYQANENVRNISYPTIGVGGPGATNSNSFQQSIGKNAGLPDFPEDLSWVGYSANANNPIDSSYFLEGGQCTVWEPKKENTSVEQEPEEENNSPEPSPVEAPEKQLNYTPKEPQLNYTPASTQPTCQPWQRLIGEC